MNEPVIIAKPECCAILSWNDDEYYSTAIAIYSEPIFFCECDMS